MYSQGGTLLHKKDGGVETDYIFAGSLLVAKKEGSNVHYLHTDLLGSPIDGKVGSTSYTENYSPWGEKLDNPIQLADDVGFTGHQSDVATGFTYMQARYYDPVIGRFLSVDPVHFHTAKTSSFGRYTYSSNSPLSRTDPDGRNDRNAWAQSVQQGCGGSSSCTSQTLGGQGFSNSEVGAVLAGADIGFAATARSAATHAGGAAKSARVTAGQRLSTGLKADVSPVALKKLSQQMVGANSALSNVQGLSSGLKLASELTMAAGPLYAAFEVSEGDAGASKLVMEGGAIAAAVFGGPVGLGAAVAYTVMDVGGAVNPISQAIDKHVKSILD